MATRIPADAVTTLHASVVAPAIVARWQVSRDGETWRDVRSFEALIRGDAVRAQHEATDAATVALFNEWARDHEP